MNDRCDNFESFSSNGPGERLAALSEAKRELVASRLRRAGYGADGPGALPRDGGMVAFPLSLAQERLWFLENVVPGRSVYNLAGAVRLIGPLDVDALFWALEQLAIRHEILRTVVASVEGKPIQVICSNAGVVPRRQDLRLLDESGREKEIVERITEQAEQAFNLSLGPLWRATLLTLSAEEHVLAVTLHHIIADVWSVGILVDELLLLYEARTTRSEPRLRKLQFQYADFAAWQRSLVARGALRDGLEYWKRELAGARTVWEFPLDHARPRVPSFRAGVESITISPVLAKQIELLSAKAQATPFMVFLCAYDVLLSQSAERPDVCVLSPVASRVVPGLDRCVGFFVNVLPLLAHVSGGASFAQLVGDVRARTLNAYLHQSVPFELMVAELGLERRADRAPLSTVAFALETEPVRRWRVGGLKVQVEEIQRHTVETDMVLTVKRGRDGVTSRLEYSRELFEPSTIARLLTGFERCLEWLVRYPDRPLSELPSTAWRPRARLENACETVAPAVSPPTRASTLMERFEVQTRRLPEKRAVATATQGSFSYAELRESAASIAKKLERCGAGVDTVVAVVGERSQQFLAAILGTIKAGSAFLPIDSRLPARRIQHMLRQSASRVLLFDRHSVGLVSEISADLKSPCELLAIDDALRDPAPWEGVACHQPGDLAYVIFTSGSSGAPKGAMIEHGGLINHLQAKIALLGLTYADRVAHTASQSFDISVWQWLAPLLVGATVEIIDDADAHDPERLVAQLEGREVSIVELVPSMLRILVDELERHAPERAPLRALRKLVVTGEPLAPVLCRRWMRLYPDVPVINAYGPTECSDDVTHFEVRVPPSAGQRRIPIGAPIDNVRLYVDDGGLVPATPGHTGELYVSGIAVGRGYVNDPEKTAEVFVRDPRSQDPTVRLYKTGDIVRVLADGNIDWLGRSDNQVKVGGCRIELEEIEATLKSHPAVGEAVVVAHVGTDGSRRLTAYVVAAKEPLPSTGEMRRFLAERLPRPMVPGGFVRMDALPLTVNMKVDRAALPAVDAGRTGTHASGEALPCSGAEALLTRIVGEVLGRQSIGPEENFFELGGDSIQSIQVCAKARRHGLCLTPKEVFQHPTIGELAAVARWESHGCGEQELVVGPVPLTPAQRSFFEQAPTNPEQYAMSLVLEVEQDLDPDLLSAAVERLTIHHDALRLRFKPSGGEWEQYSVLPQGRVPVRLADLRSSKGTARSAALTAIDARLRQDLGLSRGPLVSVSSIACGGRHGSLLGVVAHHLVCDTISAHILLEDLATIYQQLAAGCPLGLPPKTASFCEWSERLIGYARSPRCLGAIDYWLDQVDDACCRVPIDLPRGVDEDERPRTVWVRLGGAETEALVDSAASSRQATVRELLLGALVHTIAPWNGGQSVAIYVESHAREGLYPSIDVSRTVGWFAFGYPVKVASSAKRSVREAVNDVRQALSNVPDNGIGYGALKYLAPDREARALRLRPVPEVKFNYLGIVGSGRRLAQVFVRARIPSPRPTVTFQKHAHRLEVTAFVMDGRLHLSFAYDESLYRPSTVERLSSVFVDSLKQLASAAGGTHGSGKTRRHQRPASRRPPSLASAGNV